MPLTALADIKTFLGIEASDTSNDAILTMYKDQIEQAVINYCDTDFTLKTVTGEVLDGIRSDVIVPRNYPLRSVSAVYFDEVEIDANSYTISESAIYLKDHHTPMYRGIVKINYQWGYTSVPADVKMAVYHSVKASWQRHNRNNEDVRSRSKGTESESYGGVWDEATSLPKTALAMLQNYKTLEFPGVGMAQRNL